MFVNSIVVRRRLPFHDLSETEERIAMVGTVLKISPAKLAGGVKSMVSVQWDNQWNSVGIHADRMLQVIE